MASRKEPTPPSAPSGDNPNAGVMFDSAIALSQAAQGLSRIADRLELIHADMSTSIHAFTPSRSFLDELEKIGFALEALVLLTAAADHAPTLRDAAVKAATFIADKRR